MRAGEYKISSNFSCEHSRRATLSIEATPEMKYVVDVQGFKAHLNEFIFKEVVVIPVQEDAIPSVFMFEPPYPWGDLPERNKSENRWLRQNFHGLHWNSGSIPYEEIARTLDNVIMEDWATVYVKGAEKVRWLSRYLRDKFIIDMEEMGCPSLRKMPVDYHTCKNHRVPYLESICALQNAHALKKWLLEHEEKMS